MSRPVLQIVVIVLVGLPAFTNDGWAQGNAATVQEELAALFRADQEDREGDWGKLSPEEFAAITERDRQRRARVLELVRAERVTTAEDYYHAAMVLQHGEKPEDHLLAHVLATVAAFKGNPKGKWLSAAALDRFLAKSGREQFFGTNFFGSSFENLQLSPPLSGLATEALRREYDVPPPEETLKRLRGE
jgi:hypothetical protein